jgi:phosphopantothenate synthetase
MTLRHESRPNQREHAMTSTDNIIELDSRTTDDIDVRLLWHRTENRVTVTAFDMRSGEAIEVAVRDHERALDVFHHPYAYAAFHGVQPQPQTRQLTPSLS